MKTNTTRKFSIGILLGLCLLGGTVATTSGCLAVAAGAGAAGAVAYVRGELKSPVAAGYDAAVNAANRAIQDLQFAKVSERRDALLTIIVARTAADKKVEIRVENTSRELSTVRIRVGVLGDEAVSLTILDRIKARL